MLTEAMRKGEGYLTSTQRAEAQAIIENVKDHYKFIDDNKYKDLSLKSLSQTEFMAFYCAVSEEVRDAISASTTFDASALPEFMPQLMVALETEDKYNDILAFQQEINNKTTKGPSNSDDLKEIDTFKENLKALRDLNSYDSFKSHYVNKVIDKLSQMGPKYLKQYLWGDLHKNVAEFSLVDIVKISSPQFKDVIKDLNPEELSRVATLLTDLENQFKNFEVQAVGVISNEEYDDILEQFNKTGVEASFKSISDNSLNPTSVSPLMLDKERDKFYSPISKEDHTLLDNIYLTIANITNDLNLQRKNLVTTPTPSNNSAKTNKPTEAKAPQPQEVNIPEEEKVNINERSETYRFFSEYGQGFKASLDTLRDVKEILRDPEKMKELRDEIKIINSTERFYLAAGLAETHALLIKNAAQDPALYKTLNSLYDSIKTPYKGLSPLGLILDKCSDSTIYEGLKSAASQLDVGTEFNIKQGFELFLTAPNLESFSKNVLRVKKVISAVNAETGTELTIGQKIQQFFASVAKLFGLTPEKTFVLDSLAYMTGATKKNPGMTTEERQRLDTAKGITQGVSAPMRDLS